MGHMIHRCPRLVLFFMLITFILVNVLVSVSAIDDKYEKCSAPFWCGNMDISYPFWGGDRSEYCGYSGFKVDCNSGVPEITIANRIYRVLEIDSPSKKVIVAIQDYWDNNCPNNPGNSPLNFTIFDYSPNTRNISLYYGCPVSSTNEILPYRFNCSPVETNSNTANYFLTTNSGITSEYLRSCDNNVQFSVSGSTIQSIERDLYSANLTEVVRNGFELQWYANNSLCDRCQQSNGRCGHDSGNSEEFICYCSDQPHSYVCPNKGNKGKRPVVVGGIVAGSAVAGIVVVVFLLLIIRKRRKLMFFWREQTLNDQDIEALVKTYGSLAPKRYNYSDIKKMTNSFAVKLGQGGYGVVYRGKLNDGRTVAVKVLSKSKGNGEEFINEVACISRTSHVNIVGLLGFCYQRTKRALIFEFMPNGSLDKFINQVSLNTDLHLEWETLNQIVIGVARGLEYLHRGCNTRIVHFDIKPHNVLLDEDFCPKISDFGLAKICKKKESIISMLDARGTIGYTAPEVFCRNFGGVSHKSDVYGFGMMVLEMVGVRQRTAGDHKSNTSEIYFPDWIYKQIEGSSDLTIDRIVNEEEEAIARKMILVSLWCIQTNPSDRPSMSKVVEMMEGSVQSLQVPPKPFLQHSSPRSFQLYSSTTSTSLSRISSQQG